LNYNLYHKFRRGILAISILGTIFILLYSFNLSKNTYYQYECLSVGTNTKIKIWSLKKGVSYKFQNALKDGVDLILKEGLVGSNCNNLSPLLNSMSAKEKFSKIEASFFKKNGDYLKYVNLISKADESKGVKLQNNIPTYTISISLQELEKYLIQKEILKPLNKGF